MGERPPLGMVLPAVNFLCTCKNAIDVRVCCQLRHHLRHDYVTSLVTGDTGLQGERVLICSCDVGSHTQLKYEGGGRFRGSHIPSSGSSGRSSQVSRLGWILSSRFEEQKSEKRLRNCLVGEHVHSRQNETFEAPDHGESLGLAHMSFCCCVLGVDTYVSGYTKTAGIPNARNHYILCDWCW